MLLWWIDSFKPVRGQGWHLAGHYEDAQHPEFDRNGQTFYWTVPHLRNGGGRYAFALQPLPTTCDTGSCQQPATARVRVRNAIGQPTTEVSWHCDWHATNLVTGCPRGDFIDARLARLDKLVSLR